MKLHSFGALILCYIVIFLCTASDITDEADVSSSLDAVLNEQGYDAQTVEDAGIPPQQAVDDTEHPGDIAVQEAFAILRKIKPPARRVLNYAKPSGLLGTIIHYARQIFVLLFMSGSSTSEATTLFPLGLKPSGPLREAVTMLEQAAELGNSDAIFALAEMNFYGKYSHPRNYAEAFRRYQQLATSEGNSTAQHMIGFMYATGVGGAVERNQVKSFLYQRFAADGGDTRSEMTTAFRHHAGISTPRNCELALRYYKRVADKAVKYIRSGPPGGISPLKEAYSLADDEGGVYGEGASFSSSGKNAKGGPPNSDANAAFDDVLEYLDLMSRQGELKATLGLGRLHYEGSRALRQDFRTAKYYFLDVARRYWTKDGRVKADTERGVDKLASKAAGYLGRMFLRGEGMEQSFDKARIWFKRGIVNGDPLCQYSMGMMHLYGLGTSEDPIKAADHFAAAADQEHPPAQVRLGVLHLDQGDVLTATKYFELAAHSGHIEALYYLAELNNAGPPKERSCNAAMVYYKMVAEKVEPIHSSFGEANEAYERGDLETALVFYMMAAEQGYEVGQANVAYLLDKSQRRSPLVKFLPAVKRKAAAMLNDAALALMYWTRSAKQANIDSLVRLGDYYLYGLGTSGSRPDAEKAASCYQAAAEMMQSAQAMWNLGWMHENGIGIEQDFHLAKRYYDQSADTNKEAWVPVALALIKLRLRSWWGWISGGKVNQIKEDPRTGLQKRYSLREWIADFLQADIDNYEAQLAREDAATAGGANTDEWDTSASAHATGDGDIYADDVFTDDESIIETLVIVALAATLAFLVYWRQQRHTQFRRQADGHPNQQQQRPGEGQDGRIVVQDEQAAAARPEQEDRGVFPNPDDPEFHDWVAGGVGH